MPGSLTQIALVADLHGNLPATMALDRDLAARGIKQIYCLGDMVGKGPSSPETLDWALARCAVILQGNWDSGVGFMQFPNDKFYYEQLGPKRMEILRGLPQEYSFTLSGRHIRLLHGRPVMQELIPPAAPEDRLLWLFEPDYQVVAYADVHKQALRLVAEKGILLNTGAVGNGLGVTMVQYAILTGSPDDPAAPFDVTLVTLPYDREAAVRDAQALAGKLHNWDLYCREIETGRYSRNKTTPAKEL